MENKKALKIIFIILAIIAIALVVAGIIVWVQKSQSMERENQHHSSQAGDYKEKVQTIEGWEKLEVKEYSIDKQEDGTYFNATIRNNSQEPTESGDINVKVMDKEGNVILSAGLEINSIPAGEEVGIQIATDQELSDVARCTVEKE